MKSLKEITDRLNKSRGPSLLFALPPFHSNPSSPSGTRRLPKPPGSEEHRAKPLLSSHVPAWQLEMVGQVPFLSFSSFLALWDHSPRVILVILPSKWSLQVLRTSWTKQCAFSYGAWASPDTKQDTQQCDVLILIVLFATLIREEMEDKRQYCAQCHRSQVTYSSLPRCSSPCLTWVTFLVRRRHLSFDRGWSQTLEPEGLGSSHSSVTWPIIMYLLAIIIIITITIVTFNYFSRTVNGLSCALSTHKLST